MRFRRRRKIRALADLTNLIDRIMAYVKRDTVTVVQADSAAG
jgi:hypothetical protein